MRRWNVVTVRGVRARRECAGSSRGKAGAGWDPLAFVDGGSRPTGIAGALVRVNEREVGVRHLPAVEDVRGHQLLTQSEHLLPATRAEPAAECFNSLFSTLND